MKLALLLFGMIFSVALFLTLDWYRSAAIRLSSTSQTLTNGCETPDRVREHALKANCVSTAHWGGESYPFYTNSLGFRDEAPRPISKTEERPRILILGDSFTEGMGSWPDTYVGMLAARFPEYEFLNGGVTSYSPSNYLNTARMLLAENIQFDEVIVFIDISDVQDEAAFYRDINSSGAVTGPQRKPWVFGRYEQWRSFLAHRLLMTNYLFELLQRALVAVGYYHLTMGLFGDTLDMDRSAWTYRKVNERDGFYPSGAGYAPLGVEGGIAKEKAKMNLLWQALQAGQAVSVVVFPHPATLAHDSVDSKQVRIWREWCEGKCKRFINVFPAFFAAKEQCPRLEPGCWYLKYFIFGDAHYSAAGNALVSEAVSRSLSAVPVARREVQAAGADAAKGQSEQTRRPRGQLGY